MSENPHGTERDSGEAPAGSALPDIEALTALRTRLDRLAESVESLGSAVGEAHGSGATSPQSAPSEPPAVSARANHVVILEIGPFEGLVELRRFERRVAGLASVGHARVLRYGARRAEIEIVSEATAAVVS